MPMDVLLTSKPMEGGRCPTCGMLPAQRRGDPAGLGGGDGSLY
jgi:hypothetical protein